MGFFKSREFAFITIFLIGAYVLHFIDELSAYIQDFGLYGWAYVIWKGEKNHAHLLKSFFEEK